MFLIVPWILNLEPRADGLVETLREAVYKMLADDATIAGLVGDRIRPGGHPQNPVYPLVSYLIAGRQTIRSFDGGGRTSEYRLRVSAWSPRMLEAAYLAESIRARLVDARERVGAVELLGCSLIDEVDLPEPPTGGIDQHLYQVLLDLRIWRRLPPKPDRVDVASSALTTREALHDLLVSTPGLAVSGVQPAGFGQDPSYPRIGYAIAGRDDVRDFGGNGQSSDVRFRVSAWSKKVLDAAAIAELIHDRLTDFRGDVGAVKILGLEPISEIDLPTSPTAATDQNLHQVAVDYRLWRRI